MYTVYHRNYDSNTTLYEIMMNSSPSWQKTINSAEEDIRHACNKINEMGGEFCPDKQNVPRFLDLTPLDRVRVVIIGQDPYHSYHNGKKQANGLAFSTDEGCPIQPSLKNIYKELKSEYPDYEIPPHGDLTYWALQGVLLLNTCLTVKPREPFSHGKKDTGISIWSGLVEKIIASIISQNQECIYLLWGAYAIKFKSRLNEDSVKLISSHPSPFSAEKSSRDVPAFIGNGHFAKVNQILNAKGQVGIDWQIPKKKLEF